MKKGAIIGIISIVVIILLIGVYVVYDNTSEIKTIKSEKQLYEFYNKNDNKEMNFLEKMLTLPFSAMYYHSYYYGTWSDIEPVYDDYDYDGRTATNEATKGNTSKDYSKTNIQVEGVDEADIIKTDGDYIYSLSGKDVVITSTKDPSNVEIASTIELSTNPTDLLLYKDKLIIIAETSNLGSSYYNSSNTVIYVYNIKDKEKPKKEKEIALGEKYKTSRLIDGNLFIISSGSLRESNKKVDRTYEEDFNTKEIALKDIKYLKDKKSYQQTLIAEVDLNNIDKDTRVTSYLIDFKDAYVSKNNIYILNNDNNEKIKISSLFTLKGIIGFFMDLDEIYNYNDETQIIKFNIDKNKGVTYKAKTKLDGETINQYSLDEKDNNLRIALHTDEGSRIAVLDSNLKLLGETSNVARGENMYSTRFMGDKAYLVTYQNTDPLFTIDLSDPKNPKVLGKLEIPGYSTYLHPYDETHLIGIGIDTEEKVSRDINGRIISSWAVVTGMKMALFDVSDIKNPQEIDSVKIGDSRTVSAILSNPKALLFSKEKNLIAIPVNNYRDDFSIEYTENVEGLINNFNKKENYISEGYLVYNIDLEGFELKGTITHDQDLSSYRYYTVTNLLRGLYIEDNLYTVSENTIKVNKLDDLTEIGKLDLKGEKENEKR